MTKNRLWSQASAFPEWNLKIIYFIINVTISFSVFHIVNYLGFKG